MRKNQTIWIDWCNSGRSQNLANRLGVNYYTLDYFSDKPQRIFTFLRYYFASIKTIFLIIYKSPKIVMMTGSPPFPHFIVYYFSKLKKIKYVIDTHSGYFDDKKFNILLGLRRKIMKDAFFHIVTNDIHKDVIESNDGKALVLGVLIERSNSIKGYEFENKKNFVWVSNYARDEPLDIVFNVAKRMPDVNIYITGNKKKASKNFIEKCKIYHNITLTGFMPEEKYISYIKGATAVIALTTRDNTMQRGAYEALSYNVPIITSNWDLLRKSFYKGAVHINNTSIELEHAISSILNNLDNFRKEISELNLIYTEIIEEKMREIKNKLLGEL